MHCYPGLYKAIRISLLLYFALGLSACASFFPPAPEVTPTQAATFTPAPPTATSAPMAFTVNGEGITIEEFHAEVQRYQTSQANLGNTVAESEAIEVVREDLIAQLLLSQAARQSGFMLDEAGLQARAEALAAQIGGAETLSAWQAAHGYSEQVFRSALKRAAESAWMRDKILAEVPSTAEQVHVQQILLYNQATAQSFFMQLQTGADFDELAARADPLTRGDLGWVPRGYLLDPLIEEAVFNLSEGEYSNVITTDVGFHILRILARDPQRPLSPDALLVLQEQALKTWIDGQRQQANVVFLEPPAQP